MRILLVEDDHNVADYVRRGLEEENNDVAVCFDGATGLKAAQTTHFDVIVLDVMMPFVNGIEVTRRLRLERNSTPIVLLTGRDAPDDVVRGLDAGADDYLVKPFSFDVLLARLRARTRPLASDQSKLQFATLRMDLNTREVFRGDRLLPLSKTEFSLLECLMNAGGRVVTKDHLIESIWGTKEVSDNNLEVFIRYLRNKVDPPGSPRLIQTERGVGYYLKEEK